MSMAWERTHRRYELMRAVLDEIAGSPEPTIPSRLADRIEAEYGDIGAFLADVSRRWYQTFDAHLDALLAAPPPDMSHAVRSLWHDLAREHPATRHLLDAYAGHPALVAVDARHRNTLLASTGVALSVRATLTGRVS